MNVCVCVSTFAKNRNFSVDVNVTLCICGVETLTFALDLWLMSSSSLCRAFPVTFHLALQKQTNRGQNAA